MVGSSRDVEKSDTITMLQNLQIKISQSFECTVFHSKPTTMDENEEADITNRKNNTVKEDSHLKLGATEDTAKANEKANTDKAVQMLMEMSKDQNKRNREDSSEKYGKRYKASTGNEADQYTDYLHIRDIMDGHTDMESEHTNHDGTLPTGLLMTQDIAALSADVDELIQQTEPHERMYEYCDEEEEDAYKDSNSEQSGEMQQHDDQSITELQDTPRIVDLLAESQEVVTVKDIYTDWNLKAEYSKNPERDVLIMTNHPAFKHHMEVKPKGLHKQAFNFISYMNYWQNVTPTQIGTN